MKSFLVFMKGFYLNEVNFVYLKENASEDLAPSHTTLLRSCRPVTELVDTDGTSCSQ